MNDDRLEKSPVHTSSYKAALKIISQLQEAGFTALIAGGWVRDYLLGHPSKDIDIATSAHPEQVMRLFPKAIPVGAQFGVVRVIVDGHEFEIATFRSDQQYVDGRRPSQVELHSSPEEDAKRRDFTINGMFFDPISESVLDFVEGREDILKRSIRAIGDPHARFQEDRLRIIRAVRFKNSFGFSIEPSTWKALCQESCHVKEAVSPERIWQELHKMLEKGVLVACLHDMAKSSLLQNIFPVFSHVLKQPLHHTIAPLEQYRGSCLVAAICLLFRGEGRPYLNQFKEEYSLSRKEAKIVEYFLQYKDFSYRFTDARYARDFASEGFWEYLQAVACLRKGPYRFLNRMKKKREELSFWSEQVRKNSYLLTGEDLKTLGVAPGKEMGFLLQQAFSHSVMNRITSKNVLLKWVQNQL